MTAAPFSERSRARIAKPFAARAALVAALVLAAPPVAHADPGWSGAVPAKARALAERGRALHDAGDYASAIVAFTQAYAMAPSPALLFNLAQAYRLQGNCDDAVVMYQRYLATEPGPEGRALATTHLANVERCMHKQGLGIPVQTASIAVTSKSLGVTATRPAAHGANLKKDIGLGLTLGGSVALAGALYYAMQAHNSETDVSDAYTKGGKGKDVAALDDRGQDAERNARILALGGGLGVATGVVLYVLGKRAEAAPVAITPTSGGARVSLRWAF